MGIGREPKFTLEVGFDVGLGVGAEVTLGVVFDAALECD